MFKIKIIYDNFLKIKNRLFKYEPLQQKKHYADVHNAKYNFKGVKQCFQNSLWYMK